MSKEVPLQPDMFSGKLVDTRNRRQKKKAQEERQPWQMEMFSQREMAQFGVRANPKLPISPKTRLELLVEDRRTEEEKERDFQREVERLTYKMPWACVEQEVDSSDVSPTGKTTSNPDPQPGENEIE